MSQLLQAGLNVTAIGMGVVFILLTALVFIIRGMSALSHAIEGSRPAAAEANAPETAASQSRSMPQQEIVSVIGAAIAAHRKKQ